MTLSHLPDESASPTNVFDRLYNQALDQQARAGARVRDAEELERHCVQSVSPLKV
jgi:hypothetical protein